MEVDGLPRGSAPAGVVQGNGRTIRLRAGKTTIRAAKPGAYVVDLARTKVRRAQGGIKKGARLIPSQTVGRAKIRVRAGKRTVAKVRYGTILNEEAKSLPASAPVKVLGDPENPSGIVLAGSTQLKRGSIVSVPASAMLPRGLLARVLSTVQQHGQTKVSVKPVSPFEVVPVGEFTVPLKEMSKAHASVAGALSCGGVSGVAPIRKIKDIQFDGAWNTVRVLNQDIHYGFRAEVKFTLEAGLEVTKGVGAECKLSAEFPVNGMAGPVPVTGSIGGELTAFAGAGAQLKATGSVRVGIGVTTAGALARPIGSVQDPRFNLDAKTFAEARAGIGVGAKVGVGNSNVGSLTARFDNDITFTAKPGSCSWDARFGQVSIEGKILGWDVETPRTPALFTKNLWHQACGGNGGGNDGGGGSKPSNPTPPGQGGGPIGGNPVEVLASDLGTHGTDSRLACVDANDCITIPFADYASGGEAIARVTRADGSSPWQQSDPIQVPAYNPSGGGGYVVANVSAVGCESDGACTAVGTDIEPFGDYYHGSSTATERDGNWIAGGPIPAVASPDGSTMYDWVPYDIACGSSSCTVTGYVTGASAFPVAMSGSDGVWNAPQILPTPADYSPYQNWGDRGPHGFETTASCPGGGSSCVIGYVYAKGAPDHYGPTGYAWATVIQDGSGLHLQAAGVPGRDQLNPQHISDFVHLACTSVMRCVAAWTDYVLASNGQDLVSKAFASTEVDGVWHAPATIDEPAAAAQPDAGSAVFGAGCENSGTCYVQTGYSPGAEQVGSSAQIVDFVPWHADGAWGAARAINVPNSSGAALSWNGIWCADTCAGIGNAYTQGASQKTSWIAPIAESIVP